MIQPDWNAMAATIAESIMSRSSGPLIGIGHSMGGVMTLLMAAAQPNLFSRIILLDPALFSSEILLIQRLMRRTGFWQRTKMVKAVQQRRRRWPSKKELRNDLARKSLYKAWHPSALDAFVEFGTYSDAAEQVLSCDPFWEASIFGSYPYQLWHSVRSVQCPVYILVAEKSYPFISRAVRRAASINRNIAWFEQPGTHCFPMEDPAATAAFIKRLTISASVG
jgi:pimeloyl-ACP methyl ester carboxylesterase